MQRTRMTMAVLVGVAVATVSGCVTVNPGGPGSPPAASRGPVQEVEPQIGQPPAREALDALPVASPSASGRAYPAPAPVPRPDVPPPGAAPPAAHPPPRPPAALPTLSVSGLPRVTTSGKGVCALGRGIGGWSAGSPQSRICDQAYGH
ncbi:hypothetical protein [Streptomyces sp. NBC_00102]|uniref:hypothetical protein n=1 Tax=Streptomyces sp. NBC_00102 TaxID=2975652 RepID=UPI00225AE07F|nr:hypothetical protein [Streptomyces sp. NBC_00102]MCX5395556.1 hypothetical protein [Streptomyces sp. NBC_00102]